MEPQIKANTLKAINEDLPYVPEEMHESWLLEHYTDFGRPSGDGHIPWLYGGNHNLKWVQNLRWASSDIELFPSIIFGSDFQRIQGLINYLNGSVKNGLTQDDMDRAATQLALLGQRKSFPVRIALKAGSGVFRILDGNHRLAAYFHLRDISPDKVDAKQPTWIASSTV